MKLSYKHRLFFGFAIIFLVFTVSILFFEHSRESKQKTEMLKTELDTYINVANQAMLQGNNPTAILDSFMRFFPDNLRLTYIAANGEVLYDNNATITENHSTRPEIVSARQQGTGTFIRTSVTTGKEYFYYAKHFDNYYLRASLPYDIKLRSFLKADNFFLYFTIVLFVITLILINYVSERFRDSIRKLRDFTIAADDETRELPQMNFPADELGEAVTKITESYRLLRQHKHTITLEREKLLQHVHCSEEGICFFSSDRHVEFYNGFFIQYINIIADDIGISPSGIFSIPSLAKLFETEEKSFFQTRIDSHGKRFLVRINFFEDNSFEVIINDITNEEKIRKLKQEMTSNIAHELRTPVTTIRGYLETVLEQQLNPEQQRYFLSRAFDQTITLSELIRDMGLITKIEEAPDSFAREQISVCELLETLHADLEVSLFEHNITMSWNLPAEVMIDGNRNLIYSIFRNLADNSIRYAGQGVAIRIHVYNEDDRFYYFSFADNGVGIADEQHLSRLFERFYRITEGRTRDTGGTGLGLSIVKNAIALHQGTISVKNLSGGGLEFLFTLPKMTEKE